MLHIDVDPPEISLNTTEPAVVTDVLASIAMGTFRLRYAVEVAIIALFV